MKLYINDKYIKVLKEGEYYAVDKPDLEVDSLAGIQPKDLRGTVLLRKSSEDDLHSLLGWIEFKKLPFLESVICKTEDYEASKNYIKSQFRIIKAAGGLVRKKEQLLMIHRLGKWDLPKGKLERGEKAKEAAIREVKEECGVVAELDKKLCTTWHTYIQEGKRIMKKTSWFTMKCLDDSQMEPQYVENIDHIQWMTVDECQAALSNSYRSIRGVFESYLKFKEKVR
jgi:8-oxo-(d)GTP phosphatase